MASIELKEVSRTSPSLYARTIMSKGVIRTRGLEVFGDVHVQRMSIIVREMDLKARK